MIDIDQQMAHWRDGAREEWEVATELIEKGRIRHALFFTHLALEKALKAHVCRQTKDLAPRTHNLVRLAEIAGLELRSDRVDILGEMNQFGLTARYTDAATRTPTLSEAHEQQGRAHEVFQWLMRQL